MAYATPKENWVSGEIPVASDFNRIEGNTKENHDAIISEVAARVADVDAEEAARIADVNAEEAARIAADSGKQPMPVYGVPSCSIGTVIVVICDHAPARDETIRPCIRVGDTSGFVEYGMGSAGTELTGTWKARGICWIISPTEGYTVLSQRVL